MGIRANDSATICVSNASYAQMISFIISHTKYQLNILLFKHNIHIKHNI